MKTALSTLATFAFALFAAVACDADENGKSRLETSPRHHEWVAVKAGDRTVHAYLAFPEVAGKAAAVIVIHENRGLTDWVRGVADQLAAAGYIAIAPDLLSGTAPGGGRTSDYPSEDAAREGIYKLSPEQVLTDLDAVADYVAALPAASGKVAVGGFCWGGAATLRFADHRGGKLAAAYPFYGTGPDAAEGVDGIAAPVYGFYGGNDERVNATIPKTTELMKAAGKTFEPVIYEGAGHGFMRSGEAPDGPPADREARSKAWERWRELLKKL
ncbi:MAG TPA: dienelactone hydrolase family protein [Thermoanaerobaculia bacterium]